MEHKNLNVAFENSNTKENDGRARLYRNHAKLKVQILVYL